jgi:hypothetical protein
MVAGVRNQPINPTVLFEFALVVTGFDGGQVK